MAKFKPDANQSLSRKRRHQDPRADQVLSSVQEEEKKRLHVHIPAALHQKLKIEAAKRDTDMTAVVTEALNKHLS